ncbi:4624_t:CDS:1 [Funneliformis geosporum]|nr:4624_t:CDS:1 [Funneliformis geosporum]
MPFYMTNTKPIQNKLASRNLKFTVDSLIIKPKHSRVLANWVLRKDSNAKIPEDSEFIFNLIYRGSRDGFSNYNIRSKCDEQGAAIVIIKTKEDGTIVGGYNPLGISFKSIFKRALGYRYYSTTESFIFSLGDGNDFKNFMISRVVNSYYAIYESSFRNEALNFGNGDLVIDNKDVTCKQSHYENNIVDTKNYTIEEMEIFQFIMNTTDTIKETKE